MRIIVTGAAGLLGGEVCARLVAAGHQVTGLVHRNPTIRANDGSEVAAVRTLPGDVSLPRFGWDAAVHDRVAIEHDLLIHCAASVRFDLAPEDYTKVNVDGTAHALALARAGGLDVLHVSTAYVCGAGEGEVAEAPVPPGATFANGYEASKAAGEALVRASGLRWAIARPSIVTGDHARGAIREYDTIYAAFRLIAQGKVRHLPAAPGATLDFVPIDHVAGGICAIAGAMDEAAGGTFHLVSAQPLPVAQFAACIGAYPQFSAPLLVAPEDFDPAALPAVERRLYRRIAGLYASYFQRDPHFADDGLRRLAGLSCPPTGPAYIHRLIDHCIATGFLAGPSECRDNADPSAGAGPAPTASPP